jgi:Flp pilus assembly pilin Flp
MSRVMVRHTAKIRHQLAQFGADEGGATAIEYAMISIVLGVPLLAMSIILRDGLVGLLMEVANAIAEVASGE